MSLKMVSTLVVLLCVFFPASLEQVFGGVPTFGEMGEMMTGKEN